VLRVRAQLFREKWNRWRPICFQYAITAASFALERSICSGRHNRSPPHSPPRRRSRQWRESGSTSVKFAVRKRPAPSIIIVSLVDILTILLIFFVVSTTFKKDQREVQFNLPESKTATPPPPELEHALLTVS